MKDIFKKILRFLSKVFFLVFIFVAIVMAWTLVPIKNNIKILAVTSGSMAPEIQTGSVVVIKPQLDYREGDVVTFKPPVERRAKDYTTHRIIEVNQDSSGKISYITKGDANDAKDVISVSKDNVVGKKVFSVPVVGYLFGYVKTLPGLIIILILSVAVIYEEIDKIKKEVPKFVKKTNKKLSGLKSKKGKNNGKKA